MKLHELLNKSISAKSITFGQMRELVETGTFELPKIIEELDDSSANVLIDSLMNNIQHERIYVVMNPETFNYQVLQTKTYQALTLALESSEKLTPYQIRTINSRYINFYELQPKDIDSYNKILEYLLDLQKLF